MNRHPRYFSEMDRAMTEDHWKRVYNWVGIRPKSLAHRYDVSVKEVEATMRQIERRNPKPRRKTNR